MVSEWSIIKDDYLFDYGMSSKVPIIVYLSFFVKSVWENWNVAFFKVVNVNSWNLPFWGR